MFSNQEVKHCPVSLLFLFREFQPLASGNWQKVQMCVKPASWQQQTIDYERTVRERKKKRDVERHFTPFYSSLRKFLSKDKQFDYFSAHLNNVSFVLIKTVQKIEHFSTYSWTSNKNEEFYPCHRSVFGLLGIGTLFEATNFKLRKSLSKCVSFD